MSDTARTSAHDRLVDSLAGGLRPVRRLPAPGLPGARLVRGRPRAGPRPDAVRRSRGPAHPHGGGRPALRRPRRGADRRRGGARRVPDQRTGALASAGRCCPSGAGRPLDRGQRHRLPARLGGAGRRSGRHARDGGCVVFLSPSRFRCRLGSSGCCAGPVRCAPTSRRRSAGLSAAAAAAALLVPFHRTTPPRRTSPCTRVVVGLVIVANGLAGGRLLDVADRLTSRRAGPPRWSRGGPAGRSGDGTSSAGRRAPRRRSCTGRR